MRALKVLVVAMAVMIVGGLAALVAIIAGRIANAPSRPVAPGFAAPGFAAPGFAAPAIALPAGSRIEAMTAGSGRLILDLVLADGTRRLVVLDLANGRKLGEIPLRPAAK